MPNELISLENNVFLEPYKTYLLLYVLLWFKKTKTAIVGKKPKHVPQNALSAESF